MFQVVRLIISDCVTEYFDLQITINQLHVDFVAKGVSVIIKWDRFFELQSGASGITKRDNFYYKLEQLLQSSTVQRANERNGEGQ